jgi:SAM-dependent methyltransferase
MFESIFQRREHPAAWHKIPWDDPDFSRRMLLEHLSQQHDAASRRTTIIEQQVRWIHEQILSGVPASILDLGCGPGLYSARLAVLGHRCTGIDFGPASIAYARQHSAGTFIQGDVRQVAFGSDYDLVMMIFGEFNTFTPEEAADLLRKAYSALKEGGILLLEVHHADFVRRIGSTAPSWYSATQGLFSDQPYLCLQEATFAEDVAVNWHYVIDAASGAVTRYASSTQAYSDAQYRALLSAFTQVSFYPALTGTSGDDELFVIVARK